MAKPPPGWTSFLVSTPKPLLSDFDTHCVAAGTNRSAFLRHLMQFAILNKIWPKSEGRPPNRSMIKKHGGANQ